MPPLGMLCLHCVEVVVLQHKHSVPSDIVAERQVACMLVVIQQIESQAIHAAMSAARRHESVFFLNSKS